MLYRLGKPLVDFTLRQFFSKIQVFGTLPEEHGPLLVVANHPNTLIDPLLVTILYRRSLWFIAKSTLFRGALVTKILTAAHLVPVYRRQDFQETPEISAKNDETFRFTTAALNSKRAIVIFPEGMSMGERKLYPIKSGVARMALLAEEQGDFKLGVKIQPIGITYSDFSTFGSSVVIKIGAPIEVAGLKGSLRADFKKAVSVLTEEVEEALRELTVSIEDTQHQRLVEKVTKLYRSRGSELDDLTRFEIVARNVEAIAPLNPAQRDRIERRIDNFFHLAEYWKLDHNEGSISARDHKLALLLSPIVLIGALLHTIPYCAVGPIVKLIRPHHTYIATSKLSTGFIVFLLWYLVLSLVVVIVSGSYLFGAATFFGSIFSGVVANRYFTKLRILILSLRKTRGEAPTDLVRRFRDELIQELDALRVI